MTSRFSFFFFCFLFLFGSGVAQAHTLGQLPFLTINGAYADFYSASAVTINSFLPHDQAPTPYTVGQQLTFVIDRGVLSIQPGIRLDWDFADGSTATGVTTTHTYTNPGSYIVTIVAFNEKQGTKQLLETVLLTVLPKNGYQLPQALFAVNGSSVPAAGSSVTAPFGQEVVFDANTSSGSSLTYHWEFGDGQSTDGVTASHRYNPDISDAYVILRVKDGNGFLADTYIRLQNGNPWLTHPIQFLRNSITHAQGAAKVWVQVGEGVFITLLLFGALFVVSHYMEPDR